jgi:hypothetical protein
MPSDQLLLDSEGPSYTADFVLEQHAEGFYNPDIHSFRKAAHVVMRLDL